MSRQSVPKAHNRLFSLILISIGWFLIVFVRLVYIQGFKGSEFARLANEQQQNFVEVGSRRGVIYDREMHELAISVDTNSVYADPRQIESPAKTASDLARVLGLDKPELVKKLSQRTAARAFVWIKRKVSFREEESLRALQLPGIYLLKEGKRYYPNRDLAAHMLGFVGIDNNGLSGIEYSYDAELQGIPGLVLINRDAKRNSFFTEIKKPPMNGNVLILNADKNIQYIVEQELADAVTRTRAIGASIVVMDPYTGEILAVANAPKFNPNHYEDYPARCWRNSALSDAYEPGSTFKVLLAAAALEERLARPEERIDCQMGSISVRGHVFHDHKKFGLLTVNEVIEKSSDVGAIKLGIRLGENRLYEYIKTFGLGAKTNIDLPGEHLGLLQNVDRWSKISIGAISFGQEIGVTPLQMLRVISVIANGGFLVKPYLVKRILSPSGDLISSAKPERKRIVSRETADAVAKMLAGVVERGTGKQAALDGYTTAGKTGTAQKIINGLYSQTKFIASFVGFAPVENPVIAAVVVMDEPKGAFHGGEVAAPVFKRVAERILVSLDIPRSKEIKRPNAKDALLAHDDFQEFPFQNGDPDPVTKEKAPETDGPEVLVINGSKEGSVVMPDFRGKSLREVARECARLGLNLRSSGVGIAVEQIPPPNALTFPGASCDVWFSKSKRQMASQPNFPEPAGYLHVN